MGFSVSGSAALIFAGLFIAFGAWYAASADSFERVTEAQSAQTNDAVETRNARLTVAQATYNGTTDELTVRVENAGATQFTLNGTDLLVDGQYVSGWQPGATVAGDGSSDLWLAGETVVIVIDRTGRPDRVKVTARHGVADTAEVTAP